MQKVKMELIQVKVFVMRYAVFIIAMVTNANADEQHLVHTYPYGSYLLHDIFGFTADLSVPFVIDLKAVNDASVLFMDENNNQLLWVMFGGWSNSKSLAHNNADGRSVYFRGRVLDYMFFRKFKMQVVNAALNVFKYDSMKWHWMMTLENVSTPSKYYVRLKTKIYWAEWIIYTQVKIHRASWRTEIPFVNKMFLNPPIWAKQAGNLGICSLYCNADSRCKSFNFNSENGLCQGHNKNCDTETAGNFTDALSYVHYCRQHN